MFLEVYYCDFSVWNGFWYRVVFYRIFVECTKKGRIRVDIVERCNERR